MSGTLIDVRTDFFDKSFSTEVPDSGLSVHKLRHSHSLNPSPRESSVLDVELSTVTLNSFRSSIILVNYYRYWIETGMSSGQFPEGVGTRVEEFCSDVMSRVPINRTNPQLTP